MGAKADLSRRVARVMDMPAIAELSAVDRMRFVGAVEMAPRVSALPAKLIRIIRQAELELEAEHGEGLAE